MRTSASWRHRAEYAAFRSLRFLLLTLPERWALAFGASVGWVGAVVFRVRRAVVDENLARAFPEQTEVWRRRVAGRCYIHFGREAAATFRMARETVDSMVARTEVHGMEIIERLRAEGRGAIILTGHFGNWEIGGASVAARGLPIDAVAFPQSNPLFDRDLVRDRRRLGMEVILRSRASSAVLESVAAERVPAIVGDQNGGSRGLFVEFFGELASTARGPAVFSLRSGAPIVLGVAFAEPGRRHRYRIHIEEIPWRRTDDVSDDVLRMTKLHTAALERWIREAPEQYFWFHKRWKTRPPTSG